MTEQLHPEIEEQATWPKDVVYGKPGGFCAGLVRSVEAYRMFVDESSGPVFSVGKPAHNPHVISEFEEKGVIFVGRIEEVPSGSSVAFNPHGHTQADLEIARERGMTYLPTECPRVTDVKDDIARNTKEGITTIYYGQKDNKGKLHPEARAALSAGNAILITSLEDAFSEEVLAQIPDQTKLAFAWQTTHNADEVLEMARKLQENFPGIKVPKRKHTCFATRDRQKAAKEVIESGVETIVVIGDLATSSNTKSLAAVAGEKGARVFVVNDQTELNPDDFIGAGKVGIVASASAPKEQIIGVNDFFMSRGSVLREIEVADESRIAYPLPNVIRPNNS